MGKAKKVCSGVMFCVKKMELIKQFGLPEQPIIYCCPTFLVCVISMKVENNLRSIERGELERNYSY